jgi:hypothetical protein
LELKKKELPEIRVKLRKERETNEGEEEASVARRQLSWRTVRPRNEPK